MKNIRIEPIYDDQGVRLVQTIDLAIPEKEEIHSIELRVGGYLIGTVQVSRDYLGFDKEVCVDVALFPIYYPKECPNLRFDDAMVFCEEMDKTKIKAGNVWQIEHVGVENGEIK